MIRYFEWRKINDVMTFSCVDGYEKNEKKKLLYLVCYENKI